MPLAGTITSVRLSRALARQQQRVTRPGAREAQAQAVSTADASALAAERRKARKEKPEKPGQQKKAAAAAPVGGKRTKAQIIAAGMNQAAAERNAQVVPVRRRHVWIPGTEE
jgi:hypothetical protein